jgi:DNA-binding MarR family transcriptional regulator
MAGREPSLDTLEAVLIRIARQFRHKMPSEALTWTQMALLQELYRRGRLAMGEVAHTLGISGAAATSAIDRLVRDGWVRRIRSEDDRRQVWVDLSATARERMANLQQERRRHLARLVAALSAEEPPADGAGTGDGGGQEP